MELKQKNDIFRLTIAALAMACMILDPKCGIRGAEIGIELCIKTVIPSLFTFFVISIYLTPCMQTIPAWAFRPLEFLFRIPKGTGVLLLIGILGGYPVGAKIITDARRNKSISQSVADRMLAFSSNAGPAFIFGMSTSLFDHRSAPWLLWGIHILSAWLVSLLVKPPEAKCSPDEKYKRITISEAMKNAIQVMAGVCGGIILFRVILAFLQRCSFCADAGPKSYFIVYCNFCWIYFVVHGTPPVFYNSKLLYCDFKLKKPEVRVAEL